MIPEYTRTFPTSGDVSTNESPRDRRYPITASEQSNSNPRAHLRITEENGYDPELLAYLDRLTPDYVYPTTPEYLIAKYTFEGEDKGDLAFRAGDRVRVIRRTGDWWSGELNGVTGIFPRNYF